MTEYVFDTEPLIGYFYDEPGASVVTERLGEIDRDDASGAISHATAAEIVYKVARLETGDPNHESPDEDQFEVGEHDLRILRGFGVTVETPPWSVVARIKGAGGISLGDSYAAALAHAEDATLIVGADPEFSSLSVDIDVCRVRDQPD
jgi:predicted nucleic acid-binding protein